MNKTQGFTFFNIDVSSDATMMANALASATAQGMDPQVFLQSLASNSLRPYIDPKDPSKQYVTVNTGTDAEGKPQYEAVLVGNAEQMTLFRGEWEKIDTRVRRVAVAEMKLVNMLESKGLTISLDGMGVTRFTWRNVGQYGEARMDMDMLGETNDNAPVYQEESIPIPIISSGWNLSMRELEVSRRGGLPLDTDKAYWAAYAVAKKTENLFLNGAGVFKADNNRIYGLRNTPSAMTKTMQGDWASDAITGEMIVDEVADWIQDMNNQNHSGPFQLVLPARYSHKLSKDYKAESDKSILARIKEIPAIGEVMFLEQLNVDPTDATKYMVEAFLVELKEETVAVLNGMKLMNFQWQKMGPLLVQHKIAQIKVPLFRKDIEGQTGLLYAKTASVSIA